MRQSGASRPMHNEAYRVAPASRCQPPLRRHLFYPWQRHDPQRGAIGELKRIQHLRVQGHLLRRATDVLQQILSVFQIIKFLYASLGAGREMTWQCQPHQNRVLEDPVANELSLRNAASSPCCSFSAKVNQNAGNCVEVGTPAAPPAGRSRVRQPFAKRGLRRSAAAGHGSRWRRARSAPCLPAATAARAPRSR